jgi:hypothetical protein
LAFGVSVVTSLMAGHYRFISKSVHLEVSATSGQQLLTSGHPRHAMMAQFEPGCWIRCVALRQVFSIWSY